MGLGSLPGYLESDSLLPLQRVSIFGKPARHMIIHVLTYSVLAK